MTWPFLLLPGMPLSTAELSAARLDGDVVDVDDAYIPADAVETPVLRAGSLRPLVPDTLAATHLTAAWVHGALGRAPARLSVQRVAARRLAHIVHRRLAYRDARLPTRDVVLLGGVHVTTPVRTLTDLVRAGGDADVAAARRLVDAGTTAARDGIAWLAAAGAVPNKRPALRLLRSWVVPVSPT